MGYAHSAELIRVLRDIGGHLADVVDRLDQVSNELVRLNEAGNLQTITDRLDDIDRHLDGHLNAIGEEAKHLAGAVAELRIG
jgi:hypothetical protein